MKGPQGKIIMKSPVSPTHEVTYSVTEISVATMVRKELSADFLLSGRAESFSLTDLLKILRWAKDFDALLKDEGE